MTIRNLTPHLIRLAPSADPETWTEIESSGKALLNSTPGKPSEHPGCPVPVVSPTTYGGISGLPDDAEEGDLLIVAFPVASRVPAELAWRYARIHEMGQANALLARSALVNLEKQIRVLRCVVALGTGPADEAIRWTHEDHALNLCPPSAVGTPRAVTRLVRP